jgi:DNA mismatch repair ATPase MutS
MRGKLLSQKGITPKFVFKDKLSDALLCTETELKSLEKEIQNCGGCGTIANEQEQKCKAIKRQLKEEYQKLQNIKDMGSFHFPLHMGL